MEINCVSFLIYIFLLEEMATSAANKRKIRKLEEDLEEAEEGEEEIGEE